MKGYLRTVLIGTLLIVLSILFVEGLRYIAGVAFTTRGLLFRWGFVAGTLILANLTKTFKNVIALVVLAIFIGISYILSSSTMATWLLLSVIYALLMWIAWRLSIGRGVLGRWLIYIIIALLAGTTTIALEQIETRFSEEEFFTALKGLEMALLWGMLAVCNRLWILWTRESSHNYHRIKLTHIYIALALIVISGTIVVVNAYQHSFYPDSAPGFEGISSESPYICGEIIDPLPETYSGEEIFAQILELVEANPGKESPEYGMLALGYQEIEWANRFRVSLLDEARQGRFTQPNNSVKFTQYEAALRAYYYPRVLEAFPNLFLPSEIQEVEDWFNTINKRAHTVEWVDWMYALAYNKKPEGPYENQEIGAGLLAILEVENLSDPDLSADNRTYLLENPRGWNARFRNTDDAAVYQPEWINNALFQSFYTGEMNLDNLARSINWLLLQAIPDGAPLKYNHIGPATLGGTAYQGASLTKYNTALWIAGRSVDYLLSNEGYLFARPGVESSVSLEGSSPEWGSCLLFGDSGLPNQVGPLAPDKLVFRDGWIEDAVYMLINLRFTGWHRYKATNTVTLLYQGSPIVSEITDAQPFQWLPIGRSLFRDKRIPRENLNGLLIERSGLSAIVHNLTGIGSSWAQDPPYYAKVERFVTSPEVDISHTILENWHGWKHDRVIYFHKDGPIVVVDKAKGPKNNTAGIVWHVIGETGKIDRRIQLTGGIYPAEMLIIPNESDEAQINVKQLSDDTANLEVQYLTDTSGELSLITIFLLNEWIGADAFISYETGQPVLEIIKGDKTIQQPIEIYK